LKKHWNGKELSDHLVVWLGPPAALAGAISSPRTLHRVGLSLDDAMPQLHARGVKLVVELMDASEHLEKLPPHYLKKLLREISFVLGQLLVRDIPAGRDVSIFGGRRLYAQDVPADSVPSCPLPKLGFWSRTHHGI